MDDTLGYNRQKIDLETWARTPVFNFFKTFTEPFHGICVRLDCTATYQYAKDHGLSVSLSLFHRALAAAQQVENLRTRIVDNEVWLYEQIHGSSTVGRPNGTIGFAYYHFHEKLDAFVQAATPEVERVKRCNDLDLRAEPNLILFSVIPWLDFTSISHARNFAFHASAPLVTFGKITETDGRRTMPGSCFPTLR
jgi:chloramphenicol O-acetyltransferase type A